MKPTKHCLGSRWKEKKNHLKQPFEKYVFVITILSHFYNYFIIITHLTIDML